MHMSLLGLAFGTVRYTMTRSTLRLGVLEIQLFILRQILTSQVTLNHRHK
jgi:hypothetical protein